MSPDFQSVILGSDINAYGVARAFHEKYGMISHAFAYFQLSPTKYSRIINIHITPHFDEPQIFADTLIQFAQEFTQEHPHTKLLLIPCGDVYANLLSQTEKQLRSYYLFHTLDEKLNRQLSLKDSFYALCEQHNLPHPATRVLHKEDATTIDSYEVPFSYPLVMKPVNSTQWLDVSFEGRKKAFIIDSHQEFCDLFKKSYEAGYDDAMIIQDFIPGDDSRMRVLNAYVNSHHHVRMMMLGHPILEDPTPEAIGNYAAILPDYNEELFTMIAAFLEKIEYTGVANFDIKYDERDNTYKLFEINLRQGRSSYFVTLNGCNLAQYFVEDLIENNYEDKKSPLYAHGDKLWLEVPADFINTYVVEGSDKDKALSLLKDRQWGTTLHYRKDKSLLRYLLLKHMYSIYRKRYKVHFKQKKEV